MNAALKVMRDAIGCGALDAAEVVDAGAGYAAALTRDGNYVAVGTDFGWMLLPHDVLARLVRPETFNPNTSA
jgi:hypothetical protein